MQLVVETASSLYMVNHTMFHLCDRPVRISDTVTNAHRQTCKGNHQKACMHACMHEDLHVTVTKMLSENSCIDHNALKAKLNLKLLLLGVCLTLA